MFKMVDKIKGVIKEIAEKLNESQIKWALAGGANLNLQGIEITSRDIDIIVDHKDLERVAEIFKKHGPSDPVFIKNNEGEHINFEINGIEVEVCGDYDNGTYHKIREKDGATKIINLDGIPIVVFTLESSIKAYEQTNREDKIKLIKQFINSKWQ